MQRVVFVNLHANPMLVKVLNKFIFHQSAAVKHKYLLDYLLKHNEEYEVCSYINRQGFSMASNLSPLLMRFVSLFRFWEHKLVLRKNNIPVDSVKIIKQVGDIRPDDIVLLYRHCGNQLADAADIQAFKAISMIHFWGKRSESAKMKEINPDVLVSESDLAKYSEIFKRYYPWYNRQFIVHPFVFEQRFQRRKPFSERECKAFATGTITYKKDSDFLEVYGDPCDQPSRKQIKDHSEELKSLIYCTSSDYSENAKEVKVKHDNALSRFYKAIHYKMFESQQKAYYSFDMVEQFNNYKMCIVGEEILGVPGIGFVEGMACGCAYIGQITGYYEDLGMEVGVHYIGYDGSLEDLKEKIAYYQIPEHQPDLERIANAGYEFAKANFNGDAVAEGLMKKLSEKQEEWKRTQKSN